MNIITLTNDWKNESLYFSMITGKLYSIADNVRIVNLYSDVESFDYVSAAFILKNSYKNYPKGTIHLNFVPNLNVKDADFLIAFYDENYFISLDNGFLSLVFETKPEKLYRFERPCESFDELEFYPLLVKMILKDKLNEIPKSEKEMFRNTLSEPAIMNNRIIGHILYIDIYGNLITNFTKDFIQKHCSGKKFSILLQSEKNRIEKISDNYDEIDSGELLCLYNSMNYLELAMKESNLAKLLSITKKDNVIIAFEGQKEKPKDKLFN